MKPTVSVVMPVYNGEKYLAQAIQSILDQTYTPYEIICIDDKSTDTTLSILESFGDAVRIIQNSENNGAAASRNAGILFAQGDFLAFADADDIWDSKKLASQMNQFQKDPTLDISFTMIQNFFSPELSEDFKLKRSFPTEPIPGQITGTAVIKRSSFEKVGLLNPKYRIGDFIEWMMRANSLGFKKAMVEEVLYLRRVHENNMSAHNQETHASYLNVVKEVLNRKRNKLSDL